MTARARNDTTDLELLFARLKWPVARIRWIAAQEIAKLIGHEDLGTDVRQEFLRQLGAARTSAEACTLVEIIQAFSLASHFDEAVLRQTLQHPCILSDWNLVRAFGHNRMGHEWSWEQSGPPPGNFEPDAFFLREHTHVLPPIFSVELKRLGKMVDGDLIAHWAFEWNTLMQEGGFSWSAYANYFARGSSREDEVFLRLRQRDVFVSAFMRVLHYLVVSDRMPLEAATYFSLLGQSIERAFSRLEIGTPPAAFAELQGRLCIDLKDDEALLIAAEGLSAGSEQQAALAFDLQGLEDNKRAIEFSFRTFLSFSKNIHLDSEGFLRLFDEYYIEPPSSTWVYDGPLPCAETPTLSASQPVLSLTNPVFYRGFADFHSDVLRRGVRLPAAFLYEGMMDLKPDEAGLGLHLAEQKCGAWSVWAAGWTPETPSGAGPAIGTVTLFDRPLLDQFIKKLGGHAFGAIRIRTWSREQSYLPATCEERVLCLEL